MKTLIIIPTYNEVDNLRPLLVEIFAQVPTSDILIIDDNSTDGTGRLADEIHTEQPQVHVIHRPGKLGLGTAYVVGFKYALAHGYDAVFEMDADFSHDPRHLPAFLEAIEHAHLVIGSRYIPGGNTPGWSPLRRLISGSGNIFARLLLGIPIHDCTAGFRCYRQEVLRTIGLDTIQTEGYAFQVELTYRVLNQGFKIVEIPISFVDRRVGKSKMSHKIVIEAFTYVLQARFGLHKKPGKILPSTSELSPICNYSEGVQGDPAWARGVPANSSFFCRPPKAARKEDLSSYSYFVFRRKRQVKVLVTGAAGFVGNHLVDMLVERGDEVRALVQPNQDTDSLRTLSGVEVVSGDLTDRPSLKRAVQGVQRVYHIAAKTGPWGPEKVYQAINVQGLTDLIELAMEAGVHRIVHTSSITVYGHHLRGIVTEDHPYHAENNPYSRTKIAGEQLIFKLVQERAAPVVIVRPGWIYGPRDQASFARFVSLVESGKGRLLGNGNNIVPVVYVRDVAQGLIKAGDASDDAVGRAYNIVDDRRVTQAEYLNTIADALKAPHVSRKLPFSAIYFAGWSAETIWKIIDPRKQTRPPLMTYGVTLLGGDQRFSIDRARRELGYDPEVDVKRGVAAGVQWYLKRQEHEQSSDLLTPASLS